MGVNVQIRNADLTMRVSNTSVAGLGLDAECDGSPGRRGWRWQGFPDWAASPCGALRGLQAVFPVIQRRNPILSEVDRPGHLRLLRRADDAALMFYARLTARRRKLETGSR